VPADSHLAAIPGDVFFEKSPIFVEEMTMSRRPARRGAAYIQYLVVAALIFMVIVAGFSLMSSSANTKLNQTASDVANPTNLTTRFGS
jgi:Flp pilus assembly pilin Flp